MEKLFIPVVLGTNREGRWSEKAAHFVLSEVKKRSEVETALFDVRDFDFPKDNYGEPTKDLFPEWRDAVTRADGLVIVTPEYNHGYPGTLKTLLDTLFAEYKHKAAGIVAVSNGPWGGTRAIENLIPVLVELGLTVAIPSLNFPKAPEQFHEDGSVKDEAYYERAKKFLDEVIWLSRTLKHGREN